jgi:RNA polymerase sigma-70 factor (ECF subfamily)
MRGLEELQMLPAAVEDGADREFAVAALDQLPADQHWLLTLYYIEELSSAEIAAALGITTANFRQRLHRARRTLEEKLRVVIAESVTEVA